ncbi:MAG TPA: DNA translocase FtsK 4TM domain-containing protein [Sedimentisphaerales bacterium]|nr:DNA translocase FtsK 4TM domain-containing protein [Sedimentisphaerales bacterium]HRS10501.1 DNA translocase FtsK 4TM domain-containing protein [Sedimentisphaerales bacterium]HRV47275.1 DNA translocase FtsK 4TM domain-containing protein [Sedimentisphaerales bacterium]
MATSRKSRANRNRHKIIGAGVRLALLCIGVVICLVLLFSCLGFDIGDRPSPYSYPPNEPARNWCGSMGAFAAFYLLYYIGPGVFVVLGSLLAYLLARIADRAVSQVVFRFVGMVLLTVAVSTTFYFFWPHKVYTFPLGSGGVLGVSAATFLRSRFAILGTFILVSATWAVGLALLADSIIIGVLAACGIAVRRVLGFVVPAWSVAKEHSEALSEIWQRLSARQRSLAMAGGETVEVGAKAQEDSDGDAQQEQGEYEEEGEGGEEEEPQEQDEGAQAPEAPVAPVVKRPLPMEVRQRAEKRQPPAFVQPSYDDYTLPPMELLAEPEYGYAAIQEKVVKSKASALEKLLSEFNINARVVAADTGPVVTMFELELAAGIKVSRITNLSNDIARALSAGAVRVVAPLPGKHTIGIEVPNSAKEKVRIKSLMELGGTRASKMEIPLFLGKDSAGEALVSDLTRMPHLLIAGTTGSGKSVCINSIIVSILLTKRPDEVKMILIDPKMVEMTAFSTVPHLMCPIVTETQMAVQILEWATVKMDERYALLAEARVKNIAEFNKLGAEEIVARFAPSTPDEEAQIPKKLPYIMIVIDELADLMMTASKEIEGYIVRLAQKSRAVGIHIVLATQRPQATVVTGLIKSNMPCRIGFRVAARMDSRIILDQNGAETLLGEGDMLFLKPGTSDLIRAQGTFLDEVEIRGIIKHLKDIAEPQFHPELTQLKRVDAGEMPRDELFDEAVRVVLESKRGSVSLLQRKLSIGYARASRMIEVMAAAGILGEYKGSQAREVLMTLEEYEAIRSQMTDDGEAGYADPAEEEEGEEPARAYASEGQQGYISSTADE